MSATLPPLQDGHAPITLQHLFREALDAFEDWPADAPQPGVSFQATQVSITEVFDALKGCTDIVPANVVGGVTERLTKPWQGEGPLDEMTFATAARVMSVLIRKRQLAEQRV